MVWLHGGGFSVGSAMAEPYYNGENLSRTGDVVVVSVNHRLNVLGHLDLSAYGETYKESPNVGMYDLVDALHWIKTNIANFGGNPQNITVFGESGGGAKVLALMTMPEAKGLFQKAIIESGATETMGVQFTNKEISQRVTEHTLQNLGLTANDVSKLATIPYETLTAASNQALVQTAEEYQVPGPLGGTALMREPVVDGLTLPTSPVEAGTFPGWGKDMPLLIGSNLTEWTGVSELQNIAVTQFDNKNTWSDEEINKRLHDTYGDKAEAVVAAFLKAYPHKQKKDALYIDSLIRIPMLKIMNSKASISPVYSYIFSWEPPQMGGVFMSYHTAEIPFVFHNVDMSTSATGSGATVKQLEHEMSQAWLNFARFGNPNGAGVPAWSPYTLDKGATMIFDAQSGEMYHHDKELMRILVPTYSY